MNTSDQYDVVILGTGPAGLQAAIHAARKKVSVLVMGKETKSSLYQAVNRGKIGSKWQVQSQN